MALWITDKSLMAMEYKDTTIAYRILYKLGFKYPIDDYGNITLLQLIKQPFINWYHRLLMNAMNWAILEPFNPRKLRPTILRRLGAKVGKGVFIGDYVRVDLNNSYLLVIEDGVHIAGDVRLLCHKKDLSNYKVGDVYGMQPYKYGKIHLCKNCAIGTGALVMPGVTIGEGAVIGAGALVTKDVPEWSLAIGTPAKIVKRFIPSSTSLPAEELTVF